MRLLSRALLAAAAVAGLTVATASPSLAHHNYTYECVAYPCYPEDWVEYLTQGEVTFHERGAYNCVTEPCPQPIWDHEICVTRIAACI